MVKNREHDDCFLCQEKENAIGKPLFSLMESMRHCSRICFSLHHDMMQI